ncbi:MAG: EamA family transporter [Nitrospiria bacterium]
MTWIPLSVLAALSLAMHSLAMAKMTKNGFEIGKINLNVFFLVLIFIAVQQLVLGRGYRLPSSQGLYIVIASLGAYLIIQFSLMAIATAPNPGYVGAITSLSAVVVAVGSVFLFGSHISLSKVIGIVLCLIGVYLVGK